MRRSSPRGAHGMAEVRLTASAKRDLAEIDEFGTIRFGQSVAGEYLRGFYETFDLLRRHPHSGPTRSELGKGVRCIVYRSHRIFYVVIAGDVQISRIYHHSRYVQRGQLKP